MKESIDYHLIGNRIREKRELLHITQQKMADDLTISKYYISKIENGKVKATLDTLAEIANYLDITVSELISGISPLDNDYHVSEYMEVYQAASSKERQMILDISKTINGKK